MESALDPRLSKIHIQAHYAGSISRCVYHGDDEETGISKWKRYCDNENVAVVDLWISGRLRFSYDRGHKKLYDRQKTKTH